MFVVLDVLPLPHSAHNSHWGYVPSNVYVFTPIRTSPIVFLSSYIHGFVLLIGIIQTTNDDTYLHVSLPQIVAHSTKHAPLCLNEGNEWCWRRPDGRLEGRSATSTVRTATKAQSALTCGALLLHATFPVDVAGIEQSLLGRTKVRASRSSKRTSYCIVPLTNAAALDDIM